MATVDVQIYYPMQTCIHLYGRTELALQALIIVRTIMHHCSKVFTTGQTRAYNILAVWATAERLTRYFAIASIIQALIIVQTLN